MKSIKTGGRCKKHQEHCNENVEPSSNLIWIAAKPSLSLGEGLQAEEQYNKPYNSYHGRNAPNIMTMLGLARVLASVNQLVRALKVSLLVTSYTRRAPAAPEI